MLLIEVFVVGSVGLKGSKSVSHIGAGVRVEKL